MKIKQKMEKVVETKKVNSNMQRKNENFAPPISGRRYALPLWIQLKK